MRQKEVTDTITAFIDNLTEQELERVLLKMPYRFKREMQLKLNEKMPLSIKEVTDKALTLPTIYKAELRHLLRHDRNPHMKFEHMTTDQILMHLNKDQKKDLLGALKLDSTRKENDLTEKVLAMSSEYKVKLMEQLNLHAYELSTTDFGTITSIEPAVDHR